MSKIMSQEEAITAGLYMSVMPMIKHKAAQAGIDHNEVEKCLEEATVDIYVNEGNVLNSYQQSWKIDRRVWDKFFNPEVFPMTAPKKPPTKQPEDHSVKAPKSSSSRSDSYRSSRYRSRSLYRGRGEDRGSYGYSGRFSQNTGWIYGPHGMVPGDSYRPNYGKPRSGEKSWRRSRSPEKDHTHARKPREQESKSESQLNGNDGASDVKGGQPRQISASNDAYQRRWSSTSSSWYRFEDDAKSSRSGTSTAGQHRGTGENKVKDGNDASVNEVPNGNDRAKKPDTAPKVVKAEVEDGEIPGSPELVLSPSASEK